MELTGNGSVDQILVNTYYVPDVSPTLKAQHYLLTPCLGRERAVQADQFSTVWSIRGVCQVRDTHSMCRKELGKFSA